MFTRTLFCTENSFAIISQTYENTMLRMTKAKNLTFANFFEFCILWPPQLKQQDLGDN
jgi:hypothetical protein